MTVLRGQQDFLDPRDYLDLKAQQDPQAFLDPRDLLDYQALQDFLDPRDLKVIPARESKVLVVQRGLLDRPPKLGFQTIPITNE